MDLSQMDPAGIGSESPDPGKRMALADEIENAVGLICLGINMMKKSALYERRLFFPLMMLSSGIERITKVVFCMLYFKRKHEMPCRSLINGHDLVKALERVEQEMQQSPTDHHMMAISALGGKLSDPMTRAILEVLSVFGNQGRYYSLNTLESGHDPKCDFDRLWGEQVESPLYLNNPMLRSIEPAQRRLEVVYEVQVSIECLLRLIGQIVKDGGFGVLGNLAHRRLRRFTYLQDAALGLGDYSDWDKLWV
jgi:hypothetical protein